MPSDIKNVKLGVCKVLFNGSDLGYTKGGVEVSVKTESHEVTIDQFGKTVINEYLMGRTISVKVPLAETTLANLLTTMPGATMVQYGGAYATGTYTVGATLPTNGQTIVINGVTITFKTAGAVMGNNEVLIGATAAATATNLSALINGSPTFALSGVFTATVNTATVTLTNKTKGVAGNSLTMAAGTYTGGTVVAFSGGVDGTPARVDVPSGLGINLLDYSYPLVLHPVSRPDADKSEDFTVFKAATAGGLDFAYKLEDERVFNVEFGGYPDTANNGRIFAIGDTTAV